ncbi:hypothetical protein EDD17DRAFT_1577942 [Pisolithus thermaeus]|nr:hypothetical protein EDD17DRAFT_1577942 [Pisolithus thermaeus]
MNSITIVIYKIFLYSGIFAWDVVLSLGNLIRFKRPVGRVTPEGYPGYGGYWPEYMEPKEGDSCSSCPALNAMTNHGSCSFVPRFAAFMLNKSYNKDTSDLEELDLHNSIEHDAPLTR